MSSTYHEHEADLLLGLQRLQWLEALYARNEGALRQLLTQWQDADVLWDLLLRELAFWGHDALAAETACLLGQKFGDQLEHSDMGLAMAIEQHQVFFALQQYWRSDKTDEDRQAFARALVEADLVDSADQAALGDLRDAEARTQLGRLKQRFRERDLDAALLPAQMAFGQHMQAQGMNLFTAAAIMEQVFELWAFAPEEKRPEFAKWTRIPADDFWDHCRELAEHEPPDAFALIWGLPLVLDWLEQQGLSNPMVSHHLKAMLPQARQNLINEEGDGLWNFAFVTRWPGVEPAETAWFSDSYRDSHPQPQE